MLRKLLQEQEEILFPKRHFAKIPDPFTPAFMRALEQDAEMNGMAETAKQVADSTFAEYLEKQKQYEKANLDEMWEEGIHKGYKKGVKAGEAPYKRAGFLSGLVEGWEDAQTFKEPYRLYDTSKSTTIPIASGSTPADFARKVPDTKENRPWRATTGGTETTKGKGLKEWEKVSEAAYAWHADEPRISLNLNTFAAQGKERVLQGRKVHMTNAQTPTARSSKDVKNKSSLLEFMVKDQIKVPTLSKIPPRPEPTLDQQFRQEFEKSVPPPNPFVEEVGTPTKPVKLLTLPEPVLTQGGPQELNFDELVDSILAPETQKKPQPDDNIASDSSASSSPKQKKRKKSGPKHKGKISDILPAGAAQVVNNPKQLKIQELEDD